LNLSIRIFSIVSVLLYLNTASAVGLGFNAKGSHDTLNQVALIDKVFQTYPKEKVKGFVIRVSGGTLSQKTYPKGWSDTAIKAWINLQNKYELQLSFVVNGNDSSASQAGFLKRWQALGAKFLFVEMMNEYYLAKFRKGKTEKPEVTKKITAASYINEILPVFITDFKRFKLPLYIILAPQKKGRSGQHLELWNKTVIDWLNSTSTPNLGVSLHLYKRDKDVEYPYSQITSLRKRLKKDYSFAITEAGILDRSIKNSKEMGLYAIDHYKKILNYLGPSDFLLDHVLYTNYKKASAIETIHWNSKGITDKGKMVLDYFTTLK
jgi:hypothetical protein